MEQRLDGKGVKPREVGITDQRKARNHIEGKIDAKEGRTVRTRRSRKAQGKGRRAA